jgi:hypothetical protein
MSILYIHTYCIKLYKAVCKHSSPPTKLYVIRALVYDVN